MNLAWNNSNDAFRYAFGVENGPLAQMIVLLHKDRLNDIEKLLESSMRFSGRWHGLITFHEGVDIAFIPTPHGVSDVGDCILHLSAMPPKFILFTGTCGGLSSDIQIGHICIVDEGWDGSGFL